MTKKDPRAEAAAEKYAAETHPHCKPRGSGSAIYHQSRIDFLAGVSWKEANPTPQATDAKMPPRVEILKSSLEGHNRICTAFRFTEPSENTVTYVPEALLSQARAEAREKGYEEGILFLITEMNESRDQDILRALYKLKARAEKLMAAKKAKAPVEPAKAAGSPNGAVEFTTKETK